LGYGLALVGRNSDVPSVRGVKGRDELEAGLPGPKRDLGFQPGPDLLLGRAPPARGLPLLVVKGRDCPPSPRKGFAAGRLDDVGLSKLGRLGRGRSEYGRGALER